jgi:hypothetical protein
MPNLKSLKQLAKIAEEVAPAAKALSPAEQAVQLLKEKLTGQIRPEVLDKVLSSAAVPESEARSILEGNISPWTIRTDLPKDITIDEIIALGQQNIKPWSRNRLELPVDELWKHREYDRFGADRYKTSEELNALKESIEKEGIKDPLTLNVATPNDPLISGGTREQVAAKLGEGNHRLAIARKLGLKTVPVQIAGLGAVGLGGLAAKQALQSGQPETEEERWQKTMSLLGPK